MGYSNRLQKKIKGGQTWGAKRYFSRNRPRDDGYLHDRPRDCLRMETGWSLHTKFNSHDSEVIYSEYIDAEPGQTHTHKSPMYRWSGQNKTLERFYFTSSFISSNLLFNDKRP